MQYLRWKTIAVVYSTLVIGGVLAIPSPAQLLVTPATPDSLKKSVDQIRAKPVNGVYTQCTRAGEFALTFDE